MGFQTREEDLWLVRKENVAYKRFFFTPQRDMWHLTKGIVLYGGVDHERSMDDKRGIRYKMKIYIMA